MLTHFTDGGLEDQPHSEEPGGATPGVVHPFIHSFIHSYSHSYNIDKVPTECQALF